ncbi:MAG TPA: phosphosulfolactate synthase [Bacteroidales bacterium]|nr:phosphosulfolactate synthase [Bacteroidales bacterium]HPS61928.1 phosphosulfolactate synthase [Bacteroidales bacterium]
MTQFNLPYLPERTTKPRQNGIVMVMDKGLSVREAEAFVETAGHLTDFVKLGFGTSMVTQGVKEKIRVYREGGINVYMGGTLFEAFVIRDMFDDYLRYIDQFGIDTIEISDGSMAMEHDVKCGYINQLAKNYTVLSEVGSKESGIIIAPGRWIEMMQKELQAGAFKVIGEARESGNVGIYRATGKAHVQLIHKILSKVQADKILWEAPLKSQQVWFIKNFGANVNLGNIAPSEVIPLETLRLGLRGDTFFNFLPAKLKKKQPK